MSDVGFQRAAVGSGGGTSPHRRRRMLWYYTAIIDWMMANPGGKLEDCAKAVQKSRPTITAIVNSDMFQAALAERKRQFAAGQDFMLQQKLTEVSVAALDTILSKIKTKRDSIPLESLTELQDSTLSKLGYGIAPPKEAVQINVSQTNQVATPVSAGELEEARQLLRQHQMGIAMSSSVPQTPQLLEDAASPIEGAAPVKVQED